MRIGHHLWRRERLLQPGASLHEQSQVREHRGLLFKQCMKDSRYPKYELQSWVMWGASELTPPLLEESTQHLLA
jgi:hypothetical protein